MQQPPWSPVVDQDFVPEPAALMAALDLLPDRQRDVVVLRYGSQLTELETATVLEMPLGTVKTNCRRGLARMREMLSDPSATRLSTCHEAHRHHDNLLEEALRVGLAARTSDLEIPTGVGHRGRRIAQRRAARRAGAVTLPTAAAAVVAVLLLTGGRGAAPTPASAREVLRNVRAQVTQISRTGGVLETVSNGGQHMQEWAYTDLRNGISYDLMRYANRQGRLMSLYWNRARQLSGGRIKNTALEITGASKTWTTEHAVTHPQSSSAGIQSTAGQIVSALRRGRVTYQGRATFQGRPALRLELNYHIKGVRYALYVNPHTYQPIEQTVLAKPHGHPVRTHIYLRPPTAANIAHATRRPAIPQGYKYDKDTH